MATKKTTETKTRAAAKAAPTKPARKTARKPKDEHATAEIPVGPPDLAAYPVVSSENTRVGEVRLAPEVFAVRLNDHLVYEAVKEYRAAARAGTHMTKNRALVSGSGRKPWRQKGTGRARVGETRNPLWRHGGTVFGPTPRDYSFSIPTKARLAALRSALSLRVKEGGFKVVDRFELEAPKTARLRAILDRLGATGKTVLVDLQPAEALVLSGRNLPDVKIVPQTHLTAYDVMDCRNLLVSQEALSKLEERLSR
jgi:large subunit ribosomal protein L4